MRLGQGIFGHRHLSRHYCERVIFLNIRFQVWLFCMLISLTRSKTLGTLTKQRRQRQRERHQTKGFMSWTVVAHVHYNSWYISWLSSAKQQRVMTKFCLFSRTGTMAGNISHFNSEFNAGITHLPWVSSKRERCTQQIYILYVLLGVAVVIGPYWLHTLKLESKIASLWTASDLYRQQSVDLHFVKNYIFVNC